VRRRAGWLLAALLVPATIVEVGLVTMQQWRGVPSHFNIATPFDGAVFILMGLSIAVIASVIVVMTVWSFVAVDAPPALALAIRCGLVLLMISQGVGGAMIAADGPTLGAAGAGKVPHALTIHAVQVLPALVHQLRPAGPQARQRQPRCGEPGPGRADGQSDGDHPAGFFEMRVQREQQGREQPDSRCEQACHRQDYGFTQAFPALGDIDPVPAASQHALEGSGIGEELPPYRLQDQQKKEPAPQSVSR
jgi:hypothetical protein